MQRGVKWTGPCAEPKCDRPAKNKGKCNKHACADYYRARQRGQPKTRKMIHGDVCETPGCTNKYHSAGHCTSCNNRRKRTDNPELGLLRNTEYRARAIGMDFNLTIEDVRIPAFCPVLGIELRPGTNKFHDNSPSVDRFDNTKGYIKGNVNVISLKANRIKTDATYQEVKAVAMWMREQELFPK